MEYWLIRLWQECIKNNLYVDYIVTLTLRNLLLPLNMAEQMADAYVCNSSTTHITLKFYVDRFLIIYWVSKYKKFNKKSSFNFSKLHTVKILKLTYFPPAHVEKLQLQQLL